MHVVKTPESTALVKAGGPLALLSKAVAMLAEARTLNDVKNIRDFAIAAKAYARAQRLGDDAIRYAREIQRRAQARAGEILIEMREEGERSRAGRKKKSPEEGFISKPLLADLGVSRHQATLWQRLARVKAKDPNVFEKIAKNEPLTPRDEKVIESVTAKYRTKSRPPVEPEPGIEDDIKPENYLTGFLIRADQARQFAVYSGPVTKETIAVARAVAAKWSELAQKMEDSL